MTSLDPRARNATPFPVHFREFVAMMAAIMGVHALGVDAMLPALPLIGETLGAADGNQVQWIITAYMLGFGFAQLFYGPIADSYGRKPILLASLVFYGAMSLVASFAASFELMIAARVLQGIGGAAGRVLVISIVRDRYSGRQMARVMSLTFIVFLAVPILAPSLGQLILLVAPWRVIFDALAIFGFAVALWMGLRLPETLDPANRRPLDFGQIGTAMLATLSNRYSLGYTLASTLTFGSLLGYITSSQQLFDQALNAADMFALVFAVSAGSMAAASFVNSRIVERFGSRKVSHTALLAVIGTNLAHLAWALTVGETVISFTIFQCVMMFFFGLMGSNFGAMAMEPMGAIAGTASSVQGTISTVGAAMIGALIGQMFNGTTLPVVGGFLGCSSLALVVVLVTEQGRLFRAMHEAPKAQ